MICLLSIAIYSCNHSVNWLSLPNGPSNQSTTPVEDLPIHPPPLAHPSTTDIRGTLRTAGQVRQRSAPSRAFFSKGVTTMKMGWDFVGDACAKIIYKQVRLMFIKGRNLNSGLLFLCHSTLVILRNAHTTVRKPVAEQIREP